MIFVCVALLTIIKILIDVRRVTEIVRREAESIGSLVETVTTKTKSFLLHSLVADKIIPAVLGVMSVALGARRMQSLFDMDDMDILHQKKKK